MEQGRSLRVTVVLISSIILFHNLSLAGIVTIGGSSMEPTLKNGQKVSVNNYAEKINPERGDIIAFKIENTLNIKRVIGLPGEKVIVQEGSVFITSQSNPQGVRLNEPYLASDTVTGPDGEFAVPDSLYFVLGDNRGHSRDSRQFGSIPRKSIIGKVTKIL